MDLVLTEAYHNYEISFYRPPDIMAILFQIWFTVLTLKVMYSKGSI